MTRRPRLAKIAKLAGGPLSHARAHEPFGEHIYKKNMFFFFFLYMRATLCGHVCERAGAANFAIFANLGRCPAAARAPGGARR
jgi:hypothetical protein